MTVYRMPKLGDLWCHNGRKYHIDSLNINSETGKLMVAFHEYERDGGGIVVGLDIFLQHVREGDHYEFKPRFTFFRNAAQDHTPAPANVT